MATYFNNMTELTDAVYNAYNADAFTSVYAFVLDGKLGLYDVSDENDSFDGCDYQVGLGSQYDSLYDHLVGEGIDMEKSYYWGADVKDYDLDEIKTAIKKGLTLYLNVDAE